MKTVIQNTEGDNGFVEIPKEIMEALGLKVGDVLQALIRRKDGGDELVLQPQYCPGERTIVEDRYHGGYSGGKFIAWPLPLEAIPPDSQGGDIDVGVFWSEDHLAGKGDTPDLALADLERQLKVRESKFPV